jgi:protein SCO1
MLSLTSDPTADTPAKLKDYAARLGARPGWYLLSGEPANVRLALRKLGHAAETKEAHPNVLILGNERTGLWKKVFALAASDELVRLVRGVLEDR